MDNLQTGGQERESSTSTNVAYADCFSGVSGDMLLGAVLHAGLDQKLLIRELEKLSLDGLEFTVENKNIQSIGAFKVNISCDRRQELRTLPSILKILSESKLDNTVVSRSTDVFRALAKAEAKVHGIAIDKVHFHEVGALDTIVDVVGTVLGLQLLGIKQLISSALPTGHGFVKCDHGLLPLPAPAVCELLHGVPTYGIDLRQELITPTGAALIATLADGYGPMPPMSITATGYGAGSRILTNGQPNLLRLIIGKSSKVTENQSVEVIETNLDDWSPEGFPYLCELLFDRGALDVSLAPIQMKKGRPGFTLQVISPPASAHVLKVTILSETTAIGLRFRKEERLTLRRATTMVDTEWGVIKAKMVHTPAGTVIYPEYEECRKIAVLHKIPLQKIYNRIRSNGNT
jgi:uncharacterized protein (TIGR00299 family) protein